MPLPRRIPIILPAQTQNPLELVQTLYFSVKPSQIHATAMLIQCGQCNWCSTAFSVRQYELNGFDLPEIVKEAMQEHGQRMHLKEPQFEGSPMSECTCTHPRSMHNSWCIYPESSALIKEKIKAGENILSERSCLVVGCNCEGFYAHT